MTVRPGAARAVLELSGNGRCLPTECGRPLFRIADLCREIGGALGSVNVVASTGYRGMNLQFARPRSAAMEAPQCGDVTLRDRVEEVRLGAYAELAFYAAREGKRNSVFIVREIFDRSRREEAQWWITPFAKLAR